MRNLEKVRQRLTVLMAILLAIDVGLVGYLLWPGTSAAERHRQEQQLQEEYSLKARQTAPLRDMDAKLAEARIDIKKFSIEKTASHWSQISKEINKLAQQNGVSMQSIHYKQDDTGLPDLQQVAIETGIAGDYLKVAKFINALERDKLLFVINQIALRGQQGGTVELQISFETFLRETA